MAWADFGITKIRMDSTNSHIESVMMMLFPSSKIVGTEMFYTRKEVVKKLSEGTTIITVTGSAYEWVEGDKVVHYGDKYITTEGNNTTRDNLDHLPRF